VEELRELIERSADLGEPTVGADSFEERAWLPHDPEQGW